VITANFSPLAFIAARLLIVVVFIVAFFRLNSVSMARL
jgi:hypothetical protein